MKITTDQELEAAEVELRKLFKRTGELQQSIKQYKLRRAGCNTTRTPIYNVVERTTTGDN